MPKIIPMDMVWFLRPPSAADLLKDIGIFGNEERDHKSGKHARGGEWS